MTRRSSESQRQSTRLLHLLGGRNTMSLAGRGVPLAAPIWQSATFGYDEPEAVAADATCREPTTYYSRYGNPNLAAVAQAIADLEGAERALLVGSGMGAISLVFLTFLRSGDHVVAQKTHYVGAMKVLSRWLPRFGVEVTTVDATDPESFARALRPETKLVYVETPVNPTIALTDLRAVAEVARARGVLTCCDNTFATPINQRPLDHGIDLVLHSATKSLGGHSDATGGAVAGSQAHIEALWEALIVLGMMQHPFEAWLIGRGMQTVALRMDRCNRTAQGLAEHLETNPRVRRVLYPGLSSHPQHALARRQMTGFGGLMAVDVAGTYEDARRFIGRLTIPELAVSLGGTKSLAAHAASMVYPHLAAAERAAAGVSDTLVRVSVGLEDAEDLIADFDQALGK